MMAEQYQNPQLTPWVDFQAYMDRQNYNQQGQQSQQQGTGFGQMTANQGHYPRVGTQASRPGQVIYNPDGSESSEKSFSVGMDFGTGGEKTALLRSIMPNGQGNLQQYSPAAALNMFRSGQNPAIGVFDNQSQADAAAKFRSDNGGRNFKDKRFDRTGMRNWRIR
jgi:hypothetical protein